MALTSLFGNSASPTTAPISDIAVTEDTLTGRGGLALFSRYVRGTGTFDHLDRLFGALRKNGKGLSVSGLFHQLFCFLADGTSRHLVHFDTLKADEGYARGIETEPGRMASSYAIKRFFGAFGWGSIWMFRRLLRRMFLWRLKLEKPDVVVLGLDTMVMDNDEALRRQGCQPTYKKVKGFQPLQLTWSPFVVDALFRGGKKNGNAGDTAGRMVTDAVIFLRKRYDQEVAVILRLLEFARPDQVIYTNLGQGGTIDERLRDRGCETWLQPQRINELHHGRGRDELVHRALKDFRAEQLPFKRFQANAAFYYTVLVGFFLFEAFKRDVTDEVVPITAQATRMRREVLDIAAKIVRTSGRVILKVPAAVWTRLHLPELWERTAHPPAFVLA